MRDSCSNTSVGILNSGETHREAGLRTFLQPHLGGCCGGVTQVVSLRWQQQSSWMTSHLGRNASQSEQTPID